MTFSFLKFLSVSGFVSLTRKFLVTSPFWIEKEMKKWMQGFIIFLIIDYGFRDFRDLRRTERKKSLQSILWKSVLESNTPVHSLHFKRTDFFSVFYSMENMHIHFFFLYFPTFFIILDAIIFNELLVASSYIYSIYLFT